MNGKPGMMKSMEFDAIKAKNSIQKLKPELREQLLKELVGAEAYAVMWQTFKQLCNGQR